MSSLRLTMRSLLALITVAFNTLRGGDSGVTFGVAPTQHAREPKQQQPGSPGAAPPFVFPLQPLFELFAYTALTVTLSVGTLAWRQ